MPFKLDYRSFYTGLGITAGWIAVLLGLSYYARNQIGIKRWKIGLNPVYSSQAKEGEKK